MEFVFLGVPWRQRVDVKLARKGGDLAHVHFRLIALPKGGGCSGGIEGATDQAGRFQGWRWQWSPALDLIDPMATTDRLCILDGTAWETIWQLPYGPIPRRLRLRCDLPDDSERAAHLTDVGRSQHACQIETPGPGE